MPEFGNLKSIDLRYIWPREDKNFTPWLFKKENLTRLADVLNMKLDPFQFFGVKLEVIQVDNSRQTPKFTVIAKPNNWISPVVEGDSRTRFGLNSTNT